MCLEAELTLPSSPDYQRQSSLQATATAGRGGRGGGVGGQSLNLVVLSLNAGRKVLQSASNPTLSRQTRGLIGKNGSGESGGGT